MAGLLRATGHDCAHVYDLGLGAQPDEQIMAVDDFALRRGQVYATILMYAETGQRAGVLASRATVDSGPGGRFPGSWSCTCGRPCHGYSAPVAAACKRADVVPCLVEPVVGLPPRAAAGVLIDVNQGTSAGERPLAEPLAHGAAAA
jgi:hypothetical protein